MRDINASRVQGHRIGERTSHAAAKGKDKELGGALPRILSLRPGTG